MDGGVSIPEYILARYSRDFNITNMHITVLKMLGRRRTRELPLLKDELSKCLRLVKTPQTVIARGATISEIQRLKGLTHEIESGNEVRKYETESKDVLDQYRRMKPLIRKIVFSTGTFDACSARLTDEDRERLRVIERYMDIAGKYVRVEVVKNIEVQNICTCGYDLRGIDIPDDNILKCPKCCKETVVMNLYGVAKDSKRINTSMRNEYSDGGNLLKAAKRYMALETIHPDVYKKLEQELDKYFSCAGRTKKEVIRQNPLKDNGMREGSTLKMLNEALRAIGYTKYYENAYLIGKMYWDWKPRSIQHLLDQIMEDYDITQRVFIQLPKDRKSSLGTQYRLFKHLEVRGHLCKKEDFKIADDPESLAEHDRLWEQMCIRCGNPDIYFIPTV